MGLLDDAIREHLDLKRRSGADPAEIERAEREALGPVRREPSPMALADEPPAALHEPDAVASVESVEAVEHPRPAKRRGLLRRSRGADAATSAHDADLDDDHEPRVRVRPVPRDDAPAAASALDESRPLRESAAVDEPLAVDEPPPAGNLEPDIPGHSDLTETQEPPRLRIEPAGETGHSTDVAHGQTPAPVPAPGQSGAKPEDVLGETAEYDVQSSFAGETADGDVLEETPEFLQDTPDHDRLWFEQRPPRDFDFDG